MDVKTSRHLAKTPRSCNKALQNWSKLGTFGFMLPHTITRAWIEERLDLIHPAHVVGFATLLTQLREQFDGDLDALLILACIATRVQSKDWRSTLLDHGHHPGANSPTNTLSISQFTGIPRENVRRRIRKLEERGWITRDADGNLTPTAVAAKELRPATEATITYLKLLLGAATEAHRIRPD